MGWRSVVLGAAMALPLMAQAGDWTVRFDGAGPLKIGMRFDTVNKILGDNMQRMPKELRNVPNCFQLEPARQPGLLLMFIDDVLKRVDVMEEGIASERGIALGDTVAKVERAYGEAIQRAAQLRDPAEQTLTVLAGGGQYAIRFETGKGKITGLYAGDYSQVQLTEGCQ
ncbi:hypothetical protein ACEN9F_12260 [Duganella sp. CT11-25]|uniref:hypothetical protein n=1 Tax=unclassified Duganella TaxID=2636909 RepID=UPI0039AFA29E